MSSGAVVPEGNIAIVPSKPSRVGRFRNLYLLLISILQSCSVCRAAVTRSASLSPSVANSRLKEAIVANLVFS